MSNLYTILGVFASIILITNLHNRARILFEVAFVCESWAAKGYKPSKQRAKHECSKEGGKQRAKHEWSAIARNFNIKSISVTYSQSNGEPLNAIGIATYLTKLFHSTTTSYRNTSYLMR